MPIYFKQLSCRTEGMHGALAWRTQHLHWSWWSLFGNSYIPVSYQYLMLLTYKAERNFIFLAVVPVRFLVSLWCLISHKIHHVHLLLWARDSHAIEKHKCTWASALGKSGKVELELFLAMQTTTNMTALPSTSHRELNWVKGFNPFLQRQCKVSR